MNNSLCFVGPHRKYNPFSNQYHELVPGQVSHAPDVFNLLLLVFCVSPTWYLCVCFVLCYRAISVRMLSQEM